MRNFLTRIYNALLFIFFFLYLLIIRNGANEKPVMYGILLIVGAVVLSVIPFFTNRCKKVAVRRFYLLSLITINLFIIIQAIDIFLVNITANSQLMINIRRYLIALSIAIPVTSSLFTIFYTIKDFFKKDYEFQKLDLQTIGMSVNLLTYISVCYIIFDVCRPLLIEDRKYDGIFYEGSTFTYNFKSINNVVAWLVIIFIVYLVIYAILEYIKYRVFEKNNYQ